MKIFYGGKFIEKAKLEREGIYYPIKLEYYKRIDTEENKQEIPYYGISIVKTQYIFNDTTVEVKDIKNLTKDEKRIEQILHMCKEYDVTPIGVEDIIEDLKLENIYEQNF